MFWRCLWFLTLVFLNRSEAVQTAQSRPWGCYSPSDHAPRAKHPGHQLYSSSLGCYMETKILKSNSALGESDAIHVWTLPGWWQLQSPLARMTWWQALLTTMLWGTITSVVIVFSYFHINFEFLHNNLIIKWANYKESLADGRISNPKVKNSR